MTKKHGNMQAIRKIIDVKNQSLTILLPDDFHAKQVEVIVLPIDEPLKYIKNAKLLRGKLNLTDMQNKAFQQYINESRNEWSQSI